MTTRFSVDLLHPGRIAQTWQDWFVGIQGRRRLAVFGLSALVVLLLILVGGILPTYWQLSSTLEKIPRLKKDLASADSDLSMLKSNLGALSAEARRQVRWAELLTTLSQQLPPTLKLERVELSMIAPPPAPGQPPPPAERTLRIDAVTPLRPGPPPLLDIAQFMAGLMRDPAVNRRFQLKRWEIKPPTAGGPAEEVPLLQISISLTERS